MEEWGGIAYALSSLDAHLPPDWEIVPLIKVGRDLSAEAARFMRTLTRLVPGGALHRGAGAEQPRGAALPVHRAPLRAHERRRAGMELGGAGPDGDATSTRSTSISFPDSRCAWARRRRSGRASRKPIYADLHSLFLGMQHDGIRMLQPLRRPRAWFCCFDVVQMNEEEMQQISRDPLAVAAPRDGAGA